MTASNSQRVGERSWAQRGVLNLQPEAKTVDQACARTCHSVSVHGRRVACSMCRQKRRLWIRHVRAHARKPAGAASQSSQRRARSSRDLCRSRRRGTRSREHARGGVSMSARSQQTDMCLKSIPEDERISHDKSCIRSASSTERITAQCRISFSLPTHALCNQMCSCLGVLLTTQRSNMS